MRDKFIVAFLLFLPVVMAVPALPELPRQYVNTAMPTQTGQTINCPAGCNLQNAINNANFGDTIVLEAGATYQGPINLPNKQGTGWIIIRSDQMANLPPEGTRVQPSDAQYMPKILSSGTGLQGAALYADNNGAHHYRFIGIELMVPGSVTNQGAIIQLSSSQDSTANQAHHIIFDRVYIHGHPNAEVHSALEASSEYTAIIDSRIDQIQKSDRGNGIWTTVGKGPLKIVNNHIEASNINIIFGGGDYPNANLGMEDVEIRRNYITKDPNWHGQNILVKNLFETKDVKRVLLEGNIFENNWAKGQVGFGILIKSTDQGCGNPNSFGGSTPCPHCGTSDITFRLNHIINNAQGFNFNRQCGSAPPLSRVLIEDVLVEGLGTNGPYGASTIGNLFQFAGPPDDITFRRISGDNTWNFFNLPSSGSASNFLFENIVGSDGAWGVHPGDGVNELNTIYGSSWTWQDVHIYGGKCQYPPGTQCYSSLSQVSGSMGADVSAITAATAGVKQGIPPGSCIPSNEVCDGIDNDCDGQIDENNVCQPACTPTAEVCDGVDNDCDGTVDEGCGVVQPPASSLLYHSTLDSMTAVRNPLAGDGAGAVQSSVQFVPGFSGNGALFDRGNSYIEVPQVVNGIPNVDLVKGTLNFKYKPNYNSDDNTKYRIFGASNWNSQQGGWGFGKHSNANNNGLYLMYFNSPSGSHTETFVDGSDYSWTAGNWVDVTITWDWLSNGQNVRIYLDGVEIPQIISPSGPQPTGTASSSHNIYIGNTGPGNNGNILPADGMIDEIKIWNYVNPPGNPPSGKLGDVNGDGSVDILDLVIVVNCMNGNCNGKEDLNGDGSVDILDLVIIVNNMGG